MHRGILIPKVTTMSRLENSDTRFPGAFQDWDKNSVDVVRDPPVHFHNPAYSIYEARKCLATISIKGIREPTRTPTD